MGDSHPSHHPVVAYNNTDDEFLAVWVVNQDDYTHDLWARRIKTDGSLPSWFCLLSVEAHVFNRPSIAYNTIRNEVMVVFENKYSDVDYDIWGIRASADGGAIYNPFAISISTEMETYPSIAFNSQQNQYLVAFQVAKMDGRHNIGLRLLDDTGIQVSYAEIASNSDEFRVQPEAVYNPVRNEFLVVYGYETTFSPPRVKGKVINADLTDIIASAEQIYDAPTMGKLNAQAAAGADEFLVSWSRIDSNMAFDLYGRRLTGDGTPQGDQFPIATGIFDMHLNGDIAYRPGIGYLNVSLYHNSTAADEDDIYLRFVKPGQDQTSGPEYALDTSLGRQDQPGIACDPRGACLAVYTHNPQASNTVGIRGRVIGFGQYFIPMLLR